MSISTISLKRPVSSYSKVQNLVGNLRRNRKFQLSSKNLATKSYLDLGCGPNIHDDFVNVDYMWRPGIDLCWDIRKGLPFQDGTFDGIFSEHCLEHFPLETGLEILREAKRLLKAGGRLRIVIPDAEIYLRVYVDRLNGISESKFPFEAKEQESTYYSALSSVNRIYYQDRESLFGHRCMYDFALLSKLLDSLGFHEIEKLAFRQGRDEKLLIDEPSRAIESLYVEARA